MIKNALVIGYGSIGKKHSRILGKILGSENLHVLSSQEDIPFNRIDSIDSIDNLNPDYIVIAKDTSEHLNYINEIESRLENKTVLVEKPLFDKKEKFEGIRNKYFVGYNLRFHPLLNKLKELIRQKEIYMVNIKCNSYLPNWRQNQDYSQSSSASKNRGGGVLLDLSHEIDYLMYLVGDIELLFSKNGTISDLRIDSDDHLAVFGNLKQGGMFQIYSNYFSRNLMRKVEIETKDTSYELDLLNSNLTVFNSLKKQVISRKAFTLEKTYQSIHNDIINNREDKICNIEEGLKVMEIIDQIQSSR